MRYRMLRPGGRPPAGTPITLYVMSLSGDPSDYRILWPDIGAGRLTRMLAAGRGVPVNPLDGCDLLPLLHGEAALAERTLFWRWCRQGPHRSARRGHWKYLKAGARDLLFDLKTDPGERHDLAGVRPEVVQELKRHLTDWEASLAR